MSTEHTHSHAHTLILCRGSDLAVHNSTLNTLAHMGDCDTATALLKELRQSSTVCVCVCVCVGSFFPRFVAPVCPQPTTHTVAYFFTFAHPCLDPHYTFLGRAPMCAIAPTRMPAFTSQTRAYSHTQHSRQGCQYAYLDRCSTIHPPSHTRVTCPLLRSDRDPPLT